MCNNVTNIPLIGPHGKHCNRVNNALQVCTGFKSLWNNHKHYIQFTLPALHIPNTQMWYFSLQTLPNYLDLGSNLISFNYNSYVLRNITMHNKNNYEKHLKLQSNIVTINLHSFTMHSRKYILNY